MPELVPIRYGRMLASPFAFYRGGAYLMAADLADTPRSGINVQLCGDAHLSNFGVYASPERRLVFDMNDFDETLPGPWEWDVKRLATSFEIAGRQIGLKSAETRAAVLTSVVAYRAAMTQFAGMHALDVWYAHLDLEDLVRDLTANLGKKATKAARKGVEKARSKDSLRALSRLTHYVDGEPRILSNPPLLMPVTELMNEDAANDLEESMRLLLRAYRATLPNDRKHLLEEFRIVDLGRKVVGVGSVGTRAWIALMLGRDAQDPLFLQIKEAQASVLEEFLGAARVRNHGQRVVEGQRIMQASGDIMLGWVKVPSGADDQPHYYVRQLWDGKASAEIETMSAKALAIYAHLCGWTLARAHARSGDRIAIAAYLGKSDAFDLALADFASAYADQNERDYATFAAAVKDGRLEAQTGI